MFLAIGMRRYPSGNSSFFAGFDALLFLQTLLLE
jgi:hypothetical protein